MKDKRPANSIRSNELALSLFFGPVTQGIEWSATNRLVAGLSPARPSILFGPIDSVNYQRGRILKPKPKDRVSRPSVILAQWLEESPDQNDMPQLPH